MAIHVGATSNSSHCIVTILTPSKASKAPWVPNELQALRHVHAASIPSSVLASGQAMYQIQLMESLHTKIKSIFLLWSRIYGTTFDDTWDIIVSLSDNLFLSFFRPKMRSTKRLEMICQRDSGVLMIRFEFAHYKTLCTSCSSRAARRGPARLHCGEVASPCNPRSSSNSWARYHCPVQED